MNIFTGNKTLNFFGKEDEELSPGESTSKRMRRHGSGFCLLCTCRQGSSPLESRGPTVSFTVLIGVSLCCPGWPQIHHPPFLLHLGLQAYATELGMVSLFFKMNSYNQENAVFLNSLSMMLETLRCAPKLMHASYPNCITSKGAEATCHWDN
jgi:hypothetical protein